MRMAYWDIETWDLSAPFGPILCISTLLLPEEKMVTLRQDAYVKRKKAEDMTDDRQLLIDFRESLKDRHITSGWFSKGFDISHVNSRLAYHGETELLPKALHLDAIWHFKGWRGLKPQSARMKHVAEFFKLDEQKPDVPPEVWLKARGGNKTAMDEVVERCEADVRITRMLTEKALDLGLVGNIGRYP